MSREATLKYLDEHKIKESLDSVLNAIMKERPEDPYILLGDMVGKKSRSKTIVDIVAREILDAKGQPAIDVDVITPLGTFSASRPCKPPR
jgi:enolase